MKNKPTVTIGIPAHNEECNIAKMLRSVLRQKESGFVLEAIIVACDGCTDKTADIVQEISKDNKKVQLIDDGKRLGKPSRLNNFYKLVNSDIFIAFDADVVLAHNKVVEEIVGAFNDENIGLVGGRDVPMTPENRFEKVVVTASRLWYEVRKNVGKGKNVHNHIGRVSALHKRVYKDIEIPKNMAADDVYLYFRIKELGFEFNFARNAVIYYREPNNFEDYMLQTARYMSYRPMIINHFGQWVNEYFESPLSIKLKAIGRMFLKEPVYLPIALALKIYLRFIKSKLRLSYKGSLWTIIKSTKYIPYLNGNHKNKNSKKKPTVTVGIPAYNEEANIKNLLESLLEQKSDNYNMEKILVVSDASTDKTVKYASEVKDKKIEVVDKKMRVGGIGTKSEIIKLSDGDILVLLDADTLPADNYFIEKLIEPIVRGEASLVGAETVPLPANSFFEKIGAQGHLFKKQVYKKINNGDNVYLCHGRGRAFSKELYTKFGNFPDDCPEDAYSYLFAVKNGFKFVCAEEAKIFFRAASNFRERESQSKRFISKVENLDKYFPESFVKKQLDIPFIPLVRTAFLWFFKNPIYTCSYLMWFIYVKFSKNITTKSGKWKMAASSKKLK